MNLNEENLESLNKEESNHKKGNSNIKKIVVYGTALAILSAGTITLISSLNNNNKTEKGSTSAMRCVEYPIYSEEIVPVFEERYVYKTKYKDGEEYQELVRVEKVTVGTSTKKVVVGIGKRFEKINDSMESSSLDEESSKTLTKTK